jgi:orotate phosphoribosyltransferase
MEQYKKDFIDFMLECQVLKFGSFTLKSGRQSPFFMNAGAYITGSQLFRLGKFYAQAIHNTFGDDFDVFFGPAYKGIPLAVATSIAYYELYGKEVKYCCDRKEEKDHGADKGSILGYKIKDGDRVIIIEDVTTSGKSIEEVYPKIRAQESVEGGIKIVGEIVSLNRMERAPDSNKSALEVISEKYSFKTTAIVTMDEVMEALYTNGDKKVITEELKKQLDEYYAQWGVK